MNNESRKSVLQSIFKRNGQPGKYTYLFDDLSGAVQQELRKSVLFSYDEYPVAVFFKKNSQWVLITTNRVIWCADGEMKEVEAKELVQVNMSLNYPQSNFPKSKNELNLLKLVTVSEKEYEVKVEPGPPLMAMWNVMKHMAIMKERE